MRKNILITGKPKSGKSTLLEQIISNVPDKVGFLTKEILENGVRVGFEIVSSGGHRTTLAHINFDGQFKVGRFFVSRENLESILPEFHVFRKKDLLYIDEIGQMQLVSDTFKKTVLEFFDAPNTVIATISSVFEDEFSHHLKDRADVIYIEITPDNREEKSVFISQLCKKIEKARNYVGDPTRFVIQNKDTILLKSEHGTRHIIKQGDSWSCDCPFFYAHHICSHIIATEELISSATIAP